MLITVTKSYFKTEFKIIILFMPSPPSAGFITYCVFIWYMRTRRLANNNYLNLIILIILGEEYIKLLIL